MNQIVNKIIREKNVQSLSTSIFVSAINLVTFILLVRSLGKEAFGEWVIFVTAATLVDLVRYGLTKRALIHYLSGEEENASNRYLGSGFFIDLMLAAASAILIFLVYLIFGNALGIYVLFFKYYPLLTIAAVCWNNAVAVQNAQQRFDRILFFRLMINVPFFIFVLINMSLKLNVETVIIAFMLANLPASIYSAIRRWNGLYAVRQSERKTVLKLIGYGKFTMLTSAGSSLLRSSDTLIIGLSPFLGATGVAVYSIPFKVADLIQIPLNAFLATASPRLSKCFIRGDIEGFKNNLLTYTGAVSLLFIPVVAGSALFSQQILYFFAGDGYSAEMPLMTSILLVILLYGLILPFDRFTGVALDSAEMPDKNAIKVYVMLVLNLTGNLIAVFYFKSLLLVAIVSVLFTITGMAIGWRYLNRILHINPLKIFPEGYFFYRRMAMSFRSLIN